MRLRIRPYQIIVWVSIGTPGELRWDTRSPVFPAILDTGNNHNFSMFSSQLQRWAGIATALLPMSGAIREAGRRIPLHAATVWLHRNERGTRTAAGQPYPLILEDGIAVYQAEPGGIAHLPLLGLRALTDNKLQTLIDGARLRVSIATASPWWWPFG